MKLALALSAEQVLEDRCRVSVTTLKARFLLLQHADGYKNAFIKSTMDFSCKTVSEYRYIL